ncbi:ECF transporter S component [Helcococcus sueciensis]|uniref:ECF transporter S component n=1 Tax=Helcococcus sueciensis TaxID=241555 RepID=UPI0004184DFA|nr:ECF transporter S component [Helcococcus sueciensis]
MENISRREGILSISNMVKMAIFAAMAGVLMLFKFPIPIAPTFMTVDFGDVATLMSGFVLGPVSGVITVFLKIMLNLILNGTTTAYVGEVSNFIVGSIFVFISSYIYNKYKTKKSALIGLTFGIIAMTMVATLSNYFVIFPLYAKALGMGSVDAFVNTMPNAGYINTYLDLILFAVVPFNLVKGTLNALVTFLTYKRVSKVMKGF